MQRASGAASPTAPTAVITGFGPLMKALQYHWPSGPLMIRLKSLLDWT
jgi:hypothetical protein